ncbi:hypothetical protein FQN50_009207 [Emmonsiellopsis sp. PD_5]|nr:hypothetical protein FQN50_009207 [Emmonsiellopsis sp. PD_5]
MSPTGGPGQEAILENGHWEEITPDWRPISAQVPDNTTTEWAKLVRPSGLWKSAAARGLGSGMGMINGAREAHEGKAGGGGGLLDAPGEGTGPRAARRTAYLDGIRGFAAFLVYWHHHQLWAHEAVAGDVLENAFGYNRQYFFACLPFVRTFFTGGHLAVSVFFVLSGYVLSAKPLSLLAEGDLVRFSDNIASALFRRWLRLFLPVIATTFIYMSFLHLFNIRATPEIKASWREEVWNWYCEMKNFSFIFRTGGEPWFPYNFHAWSIPVEFKGSILIYTALPAFSRCTRNARLWCELGLMFYFMYIADGWYCSLFMSGMLLCDLDLLARNHNLPRFLTRLAPHRTRLAYAALTISLYLGGVPSLNADMNVLQQSPGWSLLSHFKPQAAYDYKWFYLFLAASTLVASIPHIPPLRTFFESRFNQYLGRISFALYLVHGPVLWVLGDRLYAAVGWLNESHALKIPGWINRFPLSRGGPLGLEVAFLLPHLVLLPLTLWLAEITTRLVDEPSVRFAQWAYARARGAGAASSSSSVVLSPVAGVNVKP